MSKHVPASASVAIAGEALQGWNKVEDKLISKLSQLTKLLHHFSAFPPESPDGNEDEVDIAGQHESEIHEILNETASRIRQFKTSLEIQIQDNRVQETIEAMSSQYEDLRKASEIELNDAKSKSEQLEKDMKELQEAMEDKTQSFVSDLKQLRNELVNKTNEFESGKQTYMSEIERLKKNHESEHNEKAQKEWMELTQQLTQVQARISELQEIAETKLEEHTQALKETKTLREAEVERLKLESFIELEKMSQDCASRGAEWRAQEVEFQMELTEAAKEKMQITLSSKIQAEEGKSLLEASKQALTKEKEMTGKLKIALYQAEEEIGTLKENLTSALSSKENLSLAFEQLKMDARDAENSHCSAILEWESKANHLRTDLANMTNACVAIENDTETYKVKVHELTFQLVAKRKEMTLMMMELDQRKKENEDFSRKMERFETRIQQQIQAHEQNVQNVQKSFLSQLQEQRKGSELQLESMEGKLLRQKAEKARAKEACVEYMKAVRVVEQKMENQESKCVSQFQTYERKIVELVQKLVMLESKGPALEDDFNSLRKKVLKQAHQSKQVCMNLQETKATSAALENKLTALTQEYGATTLKYIEDIELLRRTLSEEDRGYKLALASAFESHASQLQKCMDDMQRLKDGHNHALAEITQDHQLKIYALSSKMQAEKDAEMAEQASKLESSLRWNKMEWSEEIELVKLEHERALRKLQGALEAAEKEAARLVRAHTNALKTQQEESEEEIERSKKSFTEVGKACEAVSQKLAHDLYHVKEDHMIQIREMNNSFQLQLSSTEKEWRHKLETVEEQWECRLENEQATSRKHFQSDVDELRLSLLTSFTEEKLKLETEWREEVHELKAEISELETLITQKDERVRGLLQVITQREESSRVAILEMTTGHEQETSDLMERQRAQLKELQEEGSAMIEDLKTKHRRQLEDSQRIAGKALQQMMEVKHEWQEKFETLQNRFDSRESRKEDLLRIMKLQETSVQKDSTIQQLHDKTSQLKMELVNREDTYNRIFGNSPTVQQGISDWLRPRAKTDVVKVDSGPMKVALETSKMDIVKLQKRAASARRIQNKGPDPTIRSASNQL